jgi:hypothetical protein
VSALIVQGAAAAAVVVGLLFARRKLRQGGVPGVPALEVRERRALGRDSGVAVVRWQGREILVGYGSSGVVAVDRDVPAPAEVLP